MHLDGNRLLAFARKPAPIQVTWLAYPGTTGLGAIDYRLTDRFLDPPGKFDQYYSEESVRLADAFWCYDPLTTEPEVNELPALKADHVTFGSLNNVAKVNSEDLKLWAQVLKAVDGSTLLLLAPGGSFRQRIHSTFTDEGITANRVTFVERRPRAEYLKIYHQIDIGLDTFPANGHTTSLDSFWMGVPVVTLIGQTAIGRGGLSLLKNLGLDDLVAEQPAQFVTIAAGLARDLRRLSQLRATLRTKMQASPLMDAHRFARSMEATYRLMWQRWCSSQDRQSTG